MKLAIQTSSGQALMCLIDGQRLVARIPEAGQDGPRIQERDLASLTRDLLTSANLGMRDLTGLAVDIGPGRLAATRMAVAFVNALAFARNLPTQALPAFDLLACQAASQGMSSALILRKASGKRFYWAKSQAGRCHAQSMCRSQELPAMLAQMPGTDGLVTDFSLTQSGVEGLQAQDQMARHLHIQQAEPQTLVQLLESWPIWDQQGAPYPLPLTEQAFSQSLE